jgi:hypothetical protein
MEKGGKAAIAFPFPATSLPPRSQRATEAALLGCQLTETILRFRTSDVGVSALAAACRLPEAVPDFPHSEALSVAAAAYRLPEVALCSPRTRAAVAVLLAAHAIHQPG